MTLYAERESERDREKERVKLALCLMHNISIEMIIFKRREVKVRVRDIITFVSALYIFFLSPSPKGRENY